MKKKVRDFWDENPCGAKFVDEPWGSKGFYSTLEGYRYSSHSYLLGVFEEHTGKDILEIGCGCGLDAIQFARNGNKITAIDLSRKSLELAKKGFEYNELEGDFLVGDGENIRFESCRFDVVYSFGVLHHTPNIEKAIKEIHRVLKPGGEAIIMLYHRNSWYYWVVMRFIMQTLLRMHRNLSSEEIVNVYDGVGNPLGRAYTRDEARRLFKDFSSVEMEIQYLPAYMLLPKVHVLLPGVVKSIIEFVVCRPLSRVLGWHIFLKAKK